MNGSGRHPSAGEGFAAFRGAAAKLGHRIEKSIHLRLALRLLLAISRLVDVNSFDAFSHR